MNSFIPFIIASAILVATLGPAVIYMVAQCVDQGRIAGIISVSDSRKTKF